jgi:nitroreductase
VPACTRPGSINVVDDSQTAGVNVTDAVNARRSVRAFLADPVPNEVIADLLITASRAPSGGNVQPWRIYVVNGDSMAGFRAFLADRPVEAPAYDIYPSPLHDPYRSSRFKVGEDMYATLGIERDDKAGRLAQFAKNLDFFGAPAAIFCFVDRIMGPPQWSDLGMFLQTFMLLAQEAGLDTCAQEAWAVHERAVSEFVGAPPEQRIFCGVAIGHADPEAPINTLTTEREPLEVFAKFV